MSVNIISLNQIIDLFSDFADRHYFINDFGYGPTSDIGTSRQMEFPYMWVTTTQDSVIKATNKTAIPELSFVVLFMDKTNIQDNYLEIDGVNSNNVQEVLSDMFQCLQDFVTEIQVNFNNYGIILLEDIPCYPAIDETQDSVNGWVGTITLKLKHSNCILPTGDIVQTNLSPINPVTRYLTCDTVTGCTSFQEYISNAIANVTGGTGTQITGYTYSPSTNTFTIGDSSGSTYTATFTEVSGLTSTGTISSNIISATTYQNLPQDIFVTGGTYSNGTTTFRNNSGGTFNVTGFYTGGTDVFVTGGTYTNGTATFRNNTGGTFNVTGFYTGSTDVYTTGATYSNNTFTYTNNTGGTYNVNFNTVTGLTVNGSLSATTISGDGSGITNVTATADKFLVNCRNQSGANMYKGQIVYISGSTGNKPTIRLAQANSEQTSARTFGVLYEDINNNADGNVLTIGAITTLDTRTVATHPFTVDTLSDGDTVYLSPTNAGYITNVKPYAPNHLVYIGKVIRTSPTNGFIQYQIQNGYELDELHDVVATGATNGDLIVYNSGTTLWERSKTLTGNYNVNGTLSATTISATTYQNITRKGSFGITIDGGGSAITTGVKGYIKIPYAGTITSWDIFADQTGSIVVDVWKDSYANFPPTVSDTIPGSEKPTLSSAIKNQDTNLTTWTTSVSEGDIIAFNVDSASTLTRVNLTINVTKTT